MAVTPLRTLLFAGPPGSGLATFAQLVPFQRSIRVWKAAPSSYLPTAQISLAEAAATPVRIFSLAGPPRFELAAIFQDEPFQCMISVRSAVPLLWLPTAQIFCAEIATTLVRKFSRLTPPTFGLATTFQTEPFQCTISVRSAMPLK